MSTPYRLRNQQCTQCFNCITNGNFVLVVCFGTDEFPDLYRGCWILVTLCSLDQYFFFYDGVDSR